MTPTPTVSKLLALAFVAANVFGSPLGTSANAETFRVPATTAKTVVELFTSQGCSSCPPADALLEKYIARDDVIAMTFAVDYWDYLGWKDTNARPEFSERQRNYARQRGDGMVYTPQVVVNGLEHAVGSQRSAIDKAIRETEASLATTRELLSVEIADGNITLTRAPTVSNQRLAEGTVWVALAKRATPVPIGRGENHGRSVTYHHVVRELTPLGRFPAGTDVMTTKTTTMGNGIDGCIVFIQNRKGAIIAASELWLPSPS